jgi:hypothetical protein
VIKRLLILTLSAAIAAAVTGTAFAKSTILLPGGTYLNQAATTGLSCLGGAAGTTTLIVTVPSGESGLLKLDYDFDPADATLASFSGSTTIRPEVPAGTGVTQAVPVSMSVMSADGLRATVVNASVISIVSDGTLLFDAASIGSWARDSAPTAASIGSGSSSSTASGCAGLAQLVAETTGVLSKKAAEAQHACAKGNTKDAIRKLGDFLTELSKQAPKLDAALVAHLSEEATAIRASLL